MESNLNLKAEAAVVSLITEAVGFATNANVRMHEAAKLAADKHQGVSAKVIQTIYSESIIAKDSRVQSNMRQQFASSLVCFLNAGMKIEVAPPKDGKAATFKDVATLTAGEAKANAAAVRQAAAEATQKAAIEALSPEDKTKAIAEALAAAEAAKAKKAEADKIAAKAEAAGVIKHFAAQYSRIVEFGLVGELEAAFALQGLKISLTKLAGKPKDKLSLAAQAGA